MTVKTNAQGAKRKELVIDIAEWLAVAPTYCGAPTLTSELVELRVECANPSPREFARRVGSRASD